MNMAQGTAFMTGDRIPLSPTYKHWVIVKGRGFLVEEVPLDSILPALQTLPPYSGPSTGALTPRSPATLARTFIPPPAKSSDQHFGPIQLAKAAPTSSGFIMDFALVNSSQTNLNLAADVTFFVSNTVNIFGVTTVEGGTCVKFSTNASASIITTNIVWNTSPYHMASFTAQSDDTVGGPIPGTTGNPTTNLFGGIALDVSGCANSVTITNARFSFLNNAINGTPSTTLVNVQFNRCSSMFYNSSGTFHLFNVLATKTGGVQNRPCVSCAGVTIDAENMTMDNCSNFVANPAASTISLTNCIFAAVTNWLGGAVTTNSSAVLSSDSGVFQVVGAGYFYLSQASPYRGIGTDNVNFALLASLDQSTTFAPLVLTNTFTNDTVLTPQVERDTSATPSLGYHYPAVDYLSTCAVSNATLLLTNSVVLAYYGYGIWVQNGGQLVSQGTPNQPNRVVYYNYIQEQATNLWNPVHNASNSIVASVAVYFYETNLTAGRNAYLRFTTLYAALGANYSWFSDGLTRVINSATLQDCELNGGGGQWYMDQEPTTTVITLRNDFFPRAYMHIVDSASFSAFNCLFTGSNKVIVMGHFGSPVWLSRNNAFDGANITSLDSTFTYNAYLNGTSHPTLRTGDIVTNLTWQSGPLGNYYQPGTSPLIKKGSTSATNLALYYYTVTTNQVPETTNTVSIGLPYVALGANGLPLATYWTDVPDYLADTNGALAASLTSWEMEYFGHLGIPAYGDYDSNGVSNLREFQNRRDPNKIQFAPILTNDHVNSNSVPFTINVIAGVPSSVAILVNDTNIAGATWGAYSTSNLLVSLGSTDGAYVVWIGLRGFSTNSQQTWIGATITRDTAPPVIMVTNPVVTTVSRPVIQMQGWVSETLSSLTYDLANAAGLVTNQEVFITGQFTDTNVFAFTTNYFQAFDLPLTIGTNALTLHAVDLAGNMATTNLTYTLSYAGVTNPPVVNVNWPENNALVCGTNFTLSGSLDDDTASVTVSGAGFGPTNAVVERGGSFSLPNVPITAGTNTFMLVATNAAGISSTQQCTFVQSSLGFSGNSLFSVDRSQPTVTVTGSISDSSQFVWVNGTPATVSGNTWSATIPTPTGATANLILQAGSSLTAPAGEQSLFIVMPPSVFATGYTEITSQGQYVTCLTTASLRYTSLFRTRAWTLGDGGFSLQVYHSNYEGDCNTLALWPTNWPGGEDVTGTISCDSSYEETTPETWQFSAIQATAYRSENGPDCGTTITQQPVFRYARTELGLFTGGAALAGKPQIIRLTATAETYSYSLLDQSINSPGMPLYDSDGDTPLPAIGFHINGQTMTPTSTNANVAELFMVVPAGTNIALTFAISGATNYTFNINAEPVTLQILANSNALAQTTTTMTTNTLFCVGQAVTFSTLWTPRLPAGTQTNDFRWVLSGTFVNTNWQFSLTGSTNYTNDSTLLTNEITTGWWISGGTNPPATYKARVGLGVTLPNGQYTPVSQKGLFAMSRPYAIMINSNVNGTPTVSWQLMWTGIYQSRLGLGTTNTNNMCYKYQVISPTFSGDQEIIQTCSLNFTSMFPGSCANGLDNDNPYPNTERNVIANPAPSDRINIYGLNDSPDAPSYFGNVRLDGDFVDYIMFQPYAPVAIYVPLGKITWSTRGNATYPASIISSNSVTGPTGPDYLYDWPAWECTVHNP